MIQDRGERSLGGGGSRAAVRAGLEVLVVDLDPQGNLTDVLLDFIDAIKANYHPQGPVIESPPQVTVSP